jgi:hypothetical protein
MPTARQIAASRRNSQKSTGPNTPAGRTASRFNTLKHGIDAKQQMVVDESESGLANLTAEYQEQYNPTNATERFLVDTVLNNEWCLRRFRVVAAELWKHENDLIFAKKRYDAIEAEQDIVTVTGGDASTSGPKSFVHIQHIINACERQHHRARKELDRLAASHAPIQPAPEPAPTPAQPKQSKPTSAPSASFRKNQPSAPTHHETRSESLIPDPIPSPTTCMKPNQEAS